MIRPSPYGYYYGNEADQYTFYRLPKALFTNDRYKELSDSAKVLYGLMLDRMSLSNKCGWFDDHNRVYIIFTLKNVQAFMNCKHEKAVKLLSDLDTEKGVGLIERVKRGQGKPSIIYVRKFFAAPEVKTSDNQKSGTPDLPKSRLPKNRSQDFRQSEATNNYHINTEDINNDLSDTYSIPIHSPTPSPFSELDYGGNGKGLKAISIFEKYAKIIRENIEYPTLIERYRHNREHIDEIVDLLIETVCTARTSMRIAGDDYPAELVKSKFLKLNRTHIEFILDCLRKNTTEIRNIKQYMLAVLFNAPSTIEHYYQAAVNHDLNGGF